MVEEGDMDFKVDQPIRVKVDRRFEAEQLVAVAEDCGFGTGKFKSYPDILTLMPEMMELWVGDPTGNNDHDLTYEDDYKQIVQWLEYQADSDECDCDDGTVVRDIGEDRAAVLDCPDCSVDSAENARAYNEPRPEDEEYRNALRAYLTCETGSNYGPEELFLTDDDYDIFKQVFDYIDNLEEELEDVRQERDELREKLKQIEKVMNPKIEVYFDE